MIHVTSQQQGGNVSEEGIERDRNEALRKEKRNGSQNYSTCSCRCVDIRRYGNRIQATLRDVFDAQYYSETYSDLKDAFGTNSDSIVQAL